MTDYIVVTPVRNEADMISDLASSMINQTIKPALWLFMDDGSDDGTWGLIQELKNNQLWIEGRKIKRNKGRYGEGAWPIMKKGYKIALELAKKRDINYNFIGRVDADARPEPEYFEKIIESFEENQKLGIASGVHYEDGHPTHRGHPRGAAILFRKECFEEI